MLLDENEEKDETSTASEANLRVMPWEAATQCLLASDLANVVELASDLVKSATPELPIKIILVGSVLTKPFGEYNDVDLIVLPTDGRKDQYTFGHFFPACLANYSVGKLAVRKTVYGEQYEDREGFCLYPVEGKPLHVFTVHPLVEHELDYIQIDFDEFVAAERTFSKKEVRCYSVIELQ